MNKYARRESYTGICPTHGDLYEQAWQRAFLPNNLGQTKNQIRLKTISWDKILFLIGVWLFLCLIFIIMLDLNFYLFIYSLNWWIYEIIGSC